MKIKILFFAQLRDAFGQDESLLEAEDDMTVSELAEDLFKKTGLDRFKNLPVLYAVNENYVDADEILHDGDTLVLIPPIAGG